MSNNAEWIHADYGFAEAVGPAELADLSPDGNDDGDWGILLGANESVMLYGPPEALVAFAKSILKAAEFSLPRD